MTVTYLNLVLECSSLLCHTIAVWFWAHNYLFRSKFPPLLCNYNSTYYYIMIALEKVVFIYLLQLHLVCLRERKGYVAWVYQQKEEWDEMRWDEVRSGEVRWEMTKALLSSEIGTHWSIQGHVMTRSDLYFKWILLLVFCKLIMGCKGRSRKTY